MAVDLVVGPVARARNGVIGRKGALPWRIKSDLALFKRLTLGKPVIMGRRTWESLNVRPLPRRTNIVLSRDGSFQPKGAVVSEDFSEAVQIARDQAREDGVGEVCVIGGAGLFTLALPRARRMYLMDIDAEPEGDTLFPVFDDAEWRETSSEPYPAAEGDDFSFTFRVLER